MVFDLLLSYQKFTNLLDYEGVFSYLYVEILPEFGWREINFSYLAMLKYFTVEVNLSYLAIQKYLTVMFTKIAVFWIVTTSKITNKKYPVT
jgi:hypothetical protein